MDESVAQEYLDKHQLSTLVGVPLKSIEKWTTQRRLPIVKMGKLVRYPVHEVRKRLISGELLRG